MHQLTSTFFVIGSALCLAYSGDVDVDFGINGMTITDFYDRTDVGGNLLLDNDGKIILAGSAKKQNLNDQFAMVRYNHDGSLDKNFGDIGRVVTGAISNNKYVYDGIMGLHMLSFGRIVACGRGRINHDDGLALVAYQTNGQLDTSFGGDGAFVFPDEDLEVYPLALTVDRHDRIVVIATSMNRSQTAASFTVFRFQKDGRADTNFGHNGKVITSIASGINVPRAIAIDPDDSIVVGGFNGDNKFVVLRYLDDGTLDNGFGVRGIATITFNLGGIDTLHALVIAPDGKIIVGGDVQVGSIAGIRTIDFGLARLTRDGELDLSFNKTGKQITYFVQPAASSLWALALQQDGKIIAVGDAALVKGLAAARFHDDGTLDDSFGNLGKQIVPCRGTCHWEALAIQKDHKIVVGGYVWNGKHYDMAVVRLVNEIPNQ